MSTIHCQINWASQGIQDGLKANLDRVEEKKLDHFLFRVDAFDLHYRSRRSIGD